MLFLIPACLLIAWVEVYVHRYTIPRSLFLVNFSLEQKPTFYYKIYIQSRDDFQFKSITFPFIFKEIAFYFTNYLFSLKKRISTGKDNENKSMKNAKNNNLEYK